MRKVNPPAVDWSAGKEEGARAMTCTKKLLCSKVFFSGVLWWRVGRTAEGMLEEEEAAEVMCSVRMVVLWAMQA